jgi:hypothetical protein
VERCHGTLLYKNASNAMLASPYARGITNTQIGQLGTPMGWSSDGDFDPLVAPVSGMIELARCGFERRSGTADSTVAMT